MKNIRSFLLLTLCLGITVTTIQAQTKKGTSVNEVRNNETIFTSVEQMPSYPEGDEAMAKFISENLQYPESAKGAGVQGRVMVRFVVRKDGSLDTVQILRGIDDACDAEAMRVVRIMPKWNPGRQNGSAVDVYYTIPIKFAL